MIVVAVLITPPVNVTDSTSTEPAALNVKFPTAPVIADAAVPIVNVSVESL